MPRLTNMTRYLLALCALTAVGGLPARAAVVRVELVERHDYADGRKFSNTGGYEWLRARAYFEADPNLPQNRIITDLGLAPRNARGMVEYSADLFVIKPTDSAKGNGTLLFEVSNRGGRGLEGIFNRDDGFLMERGFTLLWCGWQWDIPEAQADGLRLYAPIATDNGKRIRGPVRAEFVPSKRTTLMWLGDRNHVPYPVVEGPRLTVRTAPDGERQNVPAAAWKVVQNGQALEMASGFEPGRVYELVYTSENPRVAGLGPAAIRDIVSFFKHGGGGLLLTDQRSHMKRAIGMGTSQSGRFLRKFLYDGFNADEKGRPVFDGVWAHVAGAGRGSFNHRFAQASRDGHAMMNFFYPTDIEPFADDAIFAKAKAAGVAPKLFYTDGSYEYWGRAAALTHSSVDGDRDISVDAAARRYYLAGTQHGPGVFPPRRGEGTQFDANSNDYRFALRALLVALNAWVTTGKQPPASAYPGLANGDLTMFSQVKMPAWAPGAAPGRPHRAYQVNYGPEFESAGIVSKEPPEVGRAFATLVPQVDANGNEKGGIRLPQVAVPLATYTGWNYRTVAIGAAGEVFDMVGATFPFPKERIASLYPSRETYIAKTLEAGRALVKQGYLLEEDLVEVLERAKTQWDYFTTAR